MTVALARDVEDFLQDQKPSEVTPELEIWLLEAADKPTTPLKRADFDGIRERQLALQYPRK